MEIEWMVGLAVMENQLNKWVTQLNKVINMKYEPRIGV